MDSILEGALGQGWADSAARPQVAELEFAGVHFFGGDPRHPLAPALVARLPADSALPAGPPAWRNLLTRVHGPRLITLAVYDLDGRALDPAHLRRLAAAVPAGFRVERMGLEQARRVEADLQTEDHVHFFGSPEYFMACGIGFCALSGERIVCAASSGAVCSRGIEVQINTHPDFQHRGLATAVSAALLAHCLERGLDPHWSTRNPISLRLAKKLGYTLSGMSELQVLVAPLSAEQAL